MPMQSLEKLQETNERVESSLVQRCHFECRVERRRQQLVFSIASFAFNILS